MMITRVIPMENQRLHLILDNGDSGIFDVKPYVHAPVFQPLLDGNEFSQVTSGGYYVTWPCGADLSIDTILSHWQPVSQSA